ncbi:choice-of-anchor U domain-containing protein, partial [Chloroflexota bacterium]
AIIAWQDSRNDNYDIYAQRMNDSGIAQWTDNGTAICTAANTQSKSQLVFDGSGDAIIVWQDPRSFSGNDVYAQRMNASGIAQWTDNGTEISTATNSQLEPQLISDGSSGAIIAWQDSRNDNYDIYAQLVNQWGSLGPTPTADFYGTPTSGDAPLTVDFTDNSTGADRTAWFWDFGDSSNSTAQNPSHTYYSPGTYTVSLKVWDGEDTETKADYITVSKTAGEVWVDDDWLELNPGDPADGHTFGFDAFDNIQDAVDAVASSTINVAAGEYGAFVVSGMDSLNIVGSDGANVTDVNGGNAALITNSTNININNIDFIENNSTAIAYQNSTGSVQNLDIIAPAGLEETYAIMIQGGTPTTVAISNTHITGYPAGIYVYDDTVNISGCTVEGDGDDYGISMSLNAEVTIRGTTVSGFALGVSVGMGMIGSPSQAEIWNSEIYNNTSGIYVSSDGTINAFNNSIHDNDHGIMLKSSNNVIKGNDITNNHAAENSGIHLIGGSGNIISWNNISGNTPFGVNQQIINGTLDEEIVNARYNWWGSSSGPGGSGPGSGDAVSEYVGYEPWLSKPYKSTSTATGTGTATISPNNGVLENLQSIAEENLPAGCAEGKPNVEFPHGLFSFNITGLTAGATVTVQITLPAAVAEGIEYWKCQGGEWIQLPVGDDDGDNVITITLTDGGAGDTDGIANGTIQDPGGPAIPALVPSVSRPDVYGGRTPEAHFTYQDLTVSPTYTSPNRPIVISASVVNTGNARGSTTVYLNINGQVEQTRTVSVGPGSFERVRFTVVKSQAGMYPFSVNDMHGHFQVLAIVIQSAPESQPPVPPSSPASPTPTTYTYGEFGTGGIIAIVIIGLILIVGIIVAFRMTRPA